MNTDLIQNFVILRDYYKQIGDKWRTKAYGEAIISLNNLSFRITSIKQVKNIRGIGKTIQEKIKEYLETGKIKKVEEVKPLLKKQYTSKEDEIIKLFEG